MASLFPRIAQAENWLRNLDLCLRGKPVLPQEDSFEPVLRIPGAGFFGLKIYAQAVHSEYELHGCKTRAIIVQASPRDRSRGGFAGDLLAAARASIMDKTFADMCACMESRLADPDNPRIVSILSRKAFCDGKNEHDCLVMFRTHFALVRASAKDSGGGSFEAYLGVNFCKHPREPLSSFASMGVEDFAGFGIVKMSQREVARMRERRRAVAMSMHRRLGGASLLRPLDEHLLRIIADEADRSQLDNASVERMLAEALADPPPPRALPLPLPLPEDMSSRAAFSAWTDECKRNLADYVHCSAHLDSDAFHNLRENGMRFSAQMEWVLPPQDNPQRTVQVSVYQQSSECADVRGTGLVCQYMVPVGVYDAQVELVNRVLAADFGLQLQFVREHVLNPNDLRILKMFVSETSLATAYIALFREHAAYARVHAARGSGWNSTWGDAYRHCTDMMVTTFPYDDLNIQVFRDQCIGEEGKKGWEPVDLPGGSSRGEPPVDIIPPAWHEARGTCSSSSSRISADAASASAAAVATRAAAPEAASSKSVSSRVEFARCGGRIIE